MENSSAKSLSRTSSMGPSMDLRSADAAARRRIEELEALAASRLKEVSDATLLVSRPLTIHDGRFPGKGEFACELTWNLVHVDAGVRVEREDCRA